MFAFLKTIDREIGLKALGILLMIFGAVGFAAFTFNAPWYAWVTAFGIAFVMWILVYQILIGIAVSKFIRATQQGESALTGEEYHALKNAKGQAGINTL